jgi:hypothetical protein
MRVFISWSGDDSRTLAEFINGWLPSVIQEVEPWISTHDIDTGEKWQESLTASLADPTAIGLLIVTKTNFKQPWLLFEAGALSKLPGSRVTPPLCGIQPGRLAGTPLSQFQSVAVNKKGLLKIIADIAKKCSKHLSEEQVKATFEKWWLDFELCYKSIPFATEMDEEEDKPSQKIENALEDIMRYLRRIEQIVQPSLTLQDRIRMSEATWQGLGNVFGGGLASLSPSELDALAKLQSSDTAVKLAAALLGRKTGGRGMVKPDEVGNVVNENASKKPDGIAP